MRIAAGTARCAGVYTACRNEAFRTRHTLEACGLAVTRVTLGAVACAGTRTRCANLTIRACCACLAHRLSFVILVHVSNATHRFGVAAVAFVTTCTYCALTIASIRFRNGFVLGGQTRLQRRALAIRRLRWRLRLIVVLVVTSGDRLTLAVVMRAWCQRLVLRGVVTLATVRSANAVRRRGAICNLVLGRKAGGVVLTQPIRSHGLRDLDPLSVAARTQSCADALRVRAGERALVLGAVIASCERSAHTIVVQRALNRDELTCRVRL